MTSLAPPASAEQASTQELVENPERTFGAFGFAIGGDGSTLAVVGRKAGVIYMYSTASGSPVLQQTATASGKQPDDRFGESVTVTGDTMAVASVYRPRPSDPNCINGAVDIFKRDSSGSWVEYGTVFPTGVLYPCGGYVGNLHIGGGRLIVSNSIYGLTTYDLTGAVPEQVAKFGVVSDPNGSAAVFSLSPDGNVLVAVDGDRSIYLFDWDGTAWVRRAGKIVMPAGSLSARDADFGRVLAFDGHELFVIANSEGGVYQYAISATDATFVRKSVSPGYFQGSLGTIALTTDSVFVGGYATIQQIARSTGALVQTYPMPAYTSMSGLIASAGNLFAGAPSAAQDGAGRVFGWPITAAVAPDTVAPTVTHSVSPARNAAGWWNAPVTVTWSATDPAPSSGLGPIPAPTVVSTEGRNQAIVSPPVCDLAANCASGSTLVSIDTTRPTLTVTAPTSVAPKDTVTIGCSATDALSGIAVPCTSRTFPAIDLISGNNVFTFTATDVAGNVATKTATVTLVVTAATITDLIRIYLGNSNGAAGLLKSYTAKLTAGDLAGFIEHVNAQCCVPAGGKRFTAAQASTLISLARLLLGGQTGATI